MPSVLQVAISTPDMDDLTYRDGQLLRQPGCIPIYICAAPVEALFVDDSGVLVLTARGVERVRVSEETR